MPLGSFEPLPFRHGCAATLSPFHGDSFWLVLPPACPERGFEPSAPGGRCSEGRIGRNREYCKRQRSKTTIFQPALWMRVQRADGGVASGLLLFTSTPQSIRLAAYCQLPVRGAFCVRFTSSYIKPALKGEVDASATSRRRGCIRAALIYGNPSVNPPCGVLPAPRPGSLLGRAQLRTP